MLTGPREVLADHSDFIGYLVGLAGLGRVVHTLAEDDRRSTGPSDSDAFVHALLGLASLGAAIERLANSAMAQQIPIEESSPATGPTARWLR